MSKIKTLMLLLVLVVSSTVGYAQEYGMEYAADGYNHNSLRPIHDSHILYRKSIWYRLSLKEKQNKPFMAKNNEITKLVIEAAKMGIIRPFMNDSLRTRMTQQQFMDALKIPSEEAGLSEDEIAMGFGGEEEEDWGDGGAWGDEAATDAAAGANEYFPKDLYIMQLKEDLVFDKKRSRMIHDLQSITLLIPADKTPTGIEKELATFSYKELVQNLFKENSEAIWYNEHNERTKLNLADAFDLRLFSGKIIKYSNGQDEYIVDIYGEGKPGLVESQRYAYWLVDYETSLWEH